MKGIIQMVAAIAAIRMICMQHQAFQLLQHAPHTLSLQKSPLLCREHSATLSATHHVLLHHAQLICMRCGSLDCIRMRDGDATKSQ